MSDCTLGHGSGARLRNGAQSISVIRSMSVGFDRRPRTHARPPICDRRITVPHAGKLQKFEAQDIGNERTVGIGKIIAGKIALALQRFGHPRQQFLVLRIASVTNSESSPCSMTLRLYSARRSSGVLLISASQASRGILIKFGRNAVAKVRIMQELCTYSSISLLYIRTRWRRRGSRGISGRSGKDSSR